MRLSLSAVSPLHRMAGILAVSGFLFTGLGCAGQAYLRNTGARNVAEADYRAPIMRVEAAHGKGYYLANANRDSGALYGRPRQYLLVDVGYANAIAALSNKPLTRDQLTPYGACNDSAPAIPGPIDWRCQRTLQLTIPVAFYLFWDPFTTNAPIINTDYTFGFDLSGRIGLWRGTEQRAGIYWGHISTHIGDEYTISARSIPGARFPRVNVSYFPWRTNLGNRWYFGDGVRGSSARSYVQLAGMIEGSCLRQCSDTGYYSTDPSETAGVTVPIIGNGAEWTVTADWRKLVVWQKNVPINETSFEPASWNIGFLIGSRRVFPYLNPEADRRYALATNFTVGYQFPFARGIGVGHAELYARAYQGPNPYGQLRNQRDFYLYGAGVKFLP